MSDSFMEEDDHPFYPVEPREVPQQPEPTEQPTAPFPSDHSQGNKSSLRVRLAALLRGESHIDNLN